MKFEQIAIKNFRNFENIEICISNKNIFFGLNDIGKTNFLYALRYVFDKDIRKNGFLDSDFHRKNVASPIEITVVIDISDTADPDSQKLRAQLKGALFSHQNKVYIKSSTDFLIILAPLRKCRNCLEYQAFPAFCVSEDTPHIMAYRSLIWRSKVVKP